MTRPRHVPLGSAFFLLVASATGCGSLPSRPYTFVEHRTCDPFVLPTGPDVTVLRQVAKIENVCESELQLRLVATSCSCASLTFAPSADGLGEKAITSEFAVAPRATVFLFMSVRASAEPGRHQATATFDLSTLGRVVGREAVVATYDTLSPFKATPSVLRGVIASDSLRPQCVPLALSFEAHVPSDREVAPPSVVADGRDLLRVKVERIDREQLGPTLWRYRWRFSAELECPPAAATIEGSLHASLGGLPRHSVRVPFAFSRAEAVVVTPSVCHLGVIAGENRPLARAVFLAAPDASPFSIEGVECPAGATADWSPGLAANHRLVMTFDLTGGLKAGDAITVRTSHRLRPELRIPVEFSFAP